MYTKLEMPVVMANRGKSYDLDYALTDAYAGKWTRLVQPFNGEAAGTRVQVVRFVNAGFRGQEVSLLTEAGRSLGLASQKVIDPNPLLK